jgi:hypothetical protein
MRLDHFRLVPAICAALLGGCADSSRTTAVPTTPTYLFFNAPLSAVDPLQPTSPIAVEPVSPASSPWRMPPTWRTTIWTSAR